MRLHFWTLVLTGFIFSCNSANNDKQSGADSTQKEGSSQNTAARTVTDAVNDLKTTLESKDRNTIAAIFEFPMPDTVMAVFLDDSVFRKNYSAAGDRLTKNMFLQYFDTISRFTNLSDIIEGLKLLPLDSLRYTNKLFKEFIDKKDPCTKYYGIDIDGEEVRIIYGTNTNTSFVNSKANAEEQDIAETGCEYTAFWFFRFDGNKLKFVKHAAAG